MKKLVGKKVKWTQIDCLRGGNVVVVTGVVEDATNRRIRIRKDNGETFCGFAAYMDMKTAKVEIV